ncbi:MAG: CvpA family protein [Desulfarculus sp.]|nr:MAG: CvpA family protein [Desulfarculus sp.]
MESSPNLLDLGLLILLVFFFVRALVRGFVRETMGLVGAVVAVVVSAMFYQDLAGLLARVTGYGASWWGAVSFGLILFLIFVFFIYLGGVMHRVVMAGSLSGLDRALGGVVGLAKGLLIAYLLINLLLLMNPFSTVTPLKESLLAPYVVRGGRYILDLFPDDLTRRLQERAGLIPPAGKGKK